MALRRGIVPFRCRDEPDPARCGACGGLLEAIPEAPRARCRGWRCTAGGHRIVRLRRGVIDVCRRG